MTALASAALRRARCPKYAVVERERRFLVARIPAGAEPAVEILDRYLTGTRMRLREMRWADGTVVRKLGHKVRVGEGPAEGACTNFYLDDGTLIAEVDDRDAEPRPVPTWLEVLEDVSEQEGWTGSALAR